MLIAAFLFPVVVDSDEGQANKSSSSYILYQEVISS